MFGRGRWICPAASSKKVSMSEAGRSSSDVDLDDGGVAGDEEEGDVELWSNGS